MHKDVSRLTRQNGTLWNPRICTTNPQEFGCLTHDSTRITPCRDEREVFTYLAFRLLCEESGIVFVVIFCPLSIGVQEGLDLRVAYHVSCPRALG